MRDLAVDFRLVRLALASAQHGSFRQAAAALNVQQSWVSRGVRALEHRVGVVLFERSHTGIRPTPAGNRFLEEVAIGFDQLERAVQRISGRQCGELSIVTSVPLYALGDVFERFRREHVSVLLEMVGENCRGAALLVQQRKVDLAFVTRVPTGEPVQSMHVHDERMIVVLPRSHQLAGARSLALAELQSETFIVGTGGLGPALADYLRQHMVGVNGELRLHQHRIGQCDLVSMVASGFGITIIVGRISCHAPKDVAFVPLNAGAKLPINAIWLDANSNPALKSLLVILRQTA